MLFRVIIHHEKCNLCKLCIEICPTEVFDIIKEDDKFKIYVKNEDHCLGCGGCYTQCPTGAIEVIPKELPMREIKLDKRRIGLQL